VLNSTKLHRKTPSLQLKKDFSIQQCAGVQLSRNGSIERGVANLSKDSADSKAHLLKKNNFIEKPDSQAKLEDKRTTSKPGSRQTKKIVVTSTDHKQRDSIRDLASSSMNKSLNRLKTSFLLQKLSAEVADAKEDKVAVKHGSSTRYTLDPEITIAWSDDIKLDIESELTFVSCVGQGSFAKVYKGFDKRLKQTVAIKVIDKRKIPEHKRRQLIQTEVNILARMKHRHISEFYRIVEDHKRLFIVMEVCGISTLNIFCRKYPGKKLTEEQAHALFMQIAKGVKYIHDHNVAHRDLKLTNMLIDDDFNIKIIDFGFACEAEEFQKMYCGTPSYMAPEIVEKKLYEPRPTDMWSLGVVLFKLLTGDYAFGGRTWCNCSRGKSLFEEEYSQRRYKLS
jgi:tRNA A-37 threonylcarbamoyl transferase component Bud32